MPIPDIRRVYDRPWRDGSLHHMVREAHRQFLPRLKLRVSLRMFYDRVCDFGGARMNIEQDLLARVDEIERRVHDAETQLYGWAHRHPWVLLAVALIVGFVVGVLAGSAL